MTPSATARAIGALLPPSVPPGAMIHFAGKTIPEGWLLCNGAAVSRTTYAALFAAIGTTYGSGDGSTTFNLPDLNNRFLEGTTSSSSVGSKLSAGLPNITGKIVVGKWGDSVSTIEGALYNATGSTNIVTGGGWGTNYGLGLDASKSSGLYGDSTTVQPAALKTYTLIKT